MYDRRIGERELNFEASGALMDASLVLRDRETDSWWSIMTSGAIGGELDGTDLVELAVSEKTTWARWVAAHPGTAVLSVDGVEHVDYNPYDNYFSSDGTFRNLEIADDRLPAKEPIYSFWLDGRPWAVPHSAFAGGALLTPETLGGRGLLLDREPGAPIFASTRAWIVSAERAADGTAVELLSAAPSEGIEPLPGFDTFWYTWVAVNGETELVGVGAAE